MPTALMDLIAALQYSLERESFVFVAEDIQEILERPAELRARLFALQGVIAVGVRSMDS